MNIFPNLMKPWKQWINTNKAYTSLTLITLPHASCRVHAFSLAAPIHFLEANSFSWSETPRSQFKLTPSSPPAAVVAAVVRSALSSFTFCLYRKLPWFLLCVIACNHRLRLRAWHRYTYQLQNTIHPPTPTTTAISFETREKIPSTSSLERRFLFFSPPQQNPTIICRRASDGGEKGTLLW